MLIFLDIDGVMVPAKGWKAPELLSDNFPAFSSKAVLALRKIMTLDPISTTTIMLTTSHKGLHNKHEWRKLFETRGVVNNNFESLPKNINHLSRKEELINWFTDNAVNEKFIIIDDDKSLNELPPNLKKRLIQTTPIIGLTDEHVLLAKNILDSKFDKQSSLLNHSIPLASKI